MILAERNTAGLYVGLDVEDDVVTIVVSRDEDDGKIMRGAVVPPEKAWDAFLHPCAYLTDPSPFA